MEWSQVGRLILIGLVSAILIATYVWLLMRLFRLLQPKRDRNHSLKLANQGNVPSIYQLTVESLDSLFSFQLKFKDMPLIEVPEPVIFEELIDATNGSLSDNGHLPDGLTEKQSQKNGSQKKSVDTGKAMQAGQALAGKAGTVASLLGTFGNLIPGSIGNKLKSQGAAARGIQTKTIRATQAPKSAQRKLDAVKREGGRMGGGVKVDTGPARNQYEASTSTQGPTHRSTKYQTGKARRTAKTGEIRVQTIEIDPGESIQLSLNIRSLKRRYPEGSYLYTIQSQQIPSVGYDYEIPPITTRGTVNFKSLPAWRHWFPFIITAFIVTATAFSIFYYLTVL